MRGTLSFRGEGTPQALGGLSPPTGCNKQALQSCGAASPRQLVATTTPMSTPLGVEIIAVAFQDRGPPGPYPSVVALGGVGEPCSPTNTSASSSLPFGEVGRRKHVRKRVP